MARTMFSSILLSAMINYLIFINSVRVASATDRNVSPTIGLLKLSFYAIKGRYPKIVRNVKKSVAGKTVILTLL